MQDVKISTEIDGSLFDTEITISDSELKHYLDVLFTADELIEEARKYMAEDEGVEPEDIDINLDDAYEYFIDFEAWSAIDGIREYIEEWVLEDYEDEIYDEFAEAEPTFLEQFGMYGDIQAGGIL